MSLPSNTRSRGWIEGTLDVISSTASSAAGANRKRSSSFSGDPRSFLTRLPSQDSLDRSMHNNSGHGKSTTEAVRDLRQANAKLTKNLAEQEFEYMNQLDQQSRTMEAQRKVVEEELVQKQKHVATLESRCKSMELRFREKEDQLAKLREESAYQRHQISDLKNALNEMEMGHTGNISSSSSLSDDRYKLEVARLQRQLDVLTTTSDGDNNMIKPTQEALRRSELALAELQDEQKRMQSQHSKRVMDLKEELAVSNADWRVREEILKAQIADLKKQDNNINTSLLSDRDDVITKLREQVLDYSAQLTELTETLAKSQATAERREEYRREETDDLRILNDAQENEMALLKKQLEDAVREVELREQELHYMSRRLEETERNGGAKALVALQDQLKVAEESNEELQLQLEKTRGETAKCVADLQVKIDDLELEKAAMDTDVDGGKIRLRKRLAESEKENTKSRREISRLQAEILKQEAQFQSKLDDREAELLKLRRPARSSTGESTGSDSARVAALEAEIRRLKSMTSRSQSGGSLEEDLRKESKSARAERDNLQAELIVVKNNMEAELEELKSKLEDRDTTISALVKSTVTYEDQIESAQAELAVLRAETGRDVGDNSGIDVILAMADNSMKREVLELNQAVASHRRKEKKLKEEIARLNEEASASKQTVARLRFTALQGDKRAVTTDELEIQERDEAIANLVKQTMSQDKLVAELQEKLNNVSMELESTASPDKDISANWEEVKQLREEAEVFARQVIELDEEIDNLRTEVANRDCRVIVLEEELEKAKKNATGGGNGESGAEAKAMAKITDLEAEVDELREANETQQDELRLLRRKARNVESLPDDIAETQRKLHESEKEVGELKRKVQQADTEKDRLEKELASARNASLESTDERLRSVEKAKAAAEESVKTLTDQLAEQQSLVQQLQKEQKSLVDEADVEILRTKLNHQSSALESAKNTIRELENMVAEKSSADANAFEMEKEELLTEIDSLSKQLEEAQKKVEVVEYERGIIDDFKCKLESADEARAESEKAIVDTYERKLSLLTLDKDVTIDKLRNELAEEKEGNSEDLNEAAAEIEHYKLELKDLKEEMDAELQQRETKIFALEHTLEAQEQLVKNMRIEMDHLQGSMENAMAGRKGEAEELQEELAKLTATNAKHERELKAAEMELESKELEYKEEVTRLKDTITSLQDQNASEHRNAADLKVDLRVQDLRDRLEKLKWLNTSLKEENEGLRERLVKTEDRAREGERESRIVGELKETISVQEDKIEVLEAELEMLKASPIIVGPKHENLPPARSNSRSRQRSVSKERSPGPRRFMGRRLRAPSPARADNK